MLYLIWVYSPVDQEQNLFVSRIGFIRKLGIPVDISDRKKINISNNKLQLDHCWGGGLSQLPLLIIARVQKGRDRDRGSVSCYIWSLLECWEGGGSVAIYDHCWSVEGCGVVSWSVSILLRYWERGGWLVSCYLQLNSQSLPWLL